MSIPVPIVHKAASPRKLHRLSFATDSIFLLHPPLSNMMHGMRRFTKLTKFSRRFCTSKDVPKEHATEKAAGRGPITFASLAVAVVAVAGVVTYYELEKEKKVLQVASEIVTTGKPALGGPWILIDQDGITRTDASYKGEFALLYFGFTYCPDICPSELVKVGKIIDGLGALFVQFHELETGV